MISGSPSAQFPKLSPNDYLEWEELQREKHEYFDGQIYAMGGGSKIHSVISDRVELKSIGLTFAINSIYRGLAL